MVACSAIRIAMIRMTRMAMSQISQRGISAPWLSQQAAQRVMVPGCALRR